MGITKLDMEIRPRMVIFNEEQMQRIHSATLDVLERVGVKMSHARGLEYLDGAGCKVEGNRVRIPGWVVEDALAKAPSKVVLGNRGGQAAVVLEGENSYFGPSLDCLDYLDPGTGQRVPFTADHCRITATLADCLENFDWSMIIGMASDQPAGIADKVIARQALTYCEKPLVFCCNDLASEKAIHEMALAVCADEEAFKKYPTIVQYSEPISPLVYYDPAVDKIIYSAENGIPLINFPAPQACGTAPASFAGTIVQGSSESLSGLVLAQTVNPGSSFIYGAFATIMDMKSTIFSYGAVELSMMCGGLAQMAQYYGLPFFGTAGATDAKVNDAQAGAEAAFQCLASAAIGSGLVHDCSSWMDHGSLVSPGFMVLVNEILYMVHQFMKGIEVSNDSLCVDLIEKVGPGGNYLQEPHTFQNFRKVFYSDLFDRSILDTWKAAGSPSFEDRLRAKTLKLMEHEPDPLGNEVVRELDRMQASW